MAKFSSYFKVVAPKPGVTTMADSQAIGDQGVYANYTWYQRLIQGSASRITRYREYDLMDNDVEVARALDTIAEEMTGNDPATDAPIVLDINRDKQQHIDSSVAVTLRAALEYWSTIHDWPLRLFKLCRVTVKYGDCFFVRHRETSPWEYVHPKNVVAAIVDDRDMTRVVGWQIKRDTKVPNSPYNAQPVGQYGGSSNEMVDTIPADMVIRFTLNDDISDSAPFGESILRAVYRAQKQKELIEDSIIIYRVQRAPERRVFYIDVGKMAPQRVRAYLEQTKNEIRQKRIPTFSGGVEQVDSVYNPQSMNEDFFFAQRPDGRGSKVETLPGGQGLGELADLEYFQWKVYRGLRIPLSYTQEGSDGAVYNDGKVGIAYIEELRFAQYISRLQRHIERVMDTEFKRFLRAGGINVDPTIFKIKLAPPENFGRYRQQMIDNDLLNTFSSANSVEYLSKRFILAKYLQLDEEEILQNERSLREERGLNPDDDGIKQLPNIYGPQNVDMMGGGMGPGGMGGGMVAGGGMSGFGMDGGMDLPLPTGEEAQNLEQPVPAQSAGELPPLP